MTDQIANPNGAAAVQKLAAETGATLAADSPSTARDRIDALSIQDVELRRNQILEAAKGDYESLSTEMLHELAYIASRLRKTNVGPPKEKRAKAAPKSIDDLML